MPFFSIILPTYNRAHFLPKAIESVLSQTFEDWELVIVDDGSTDNTKEIVNGYTDQRIKYVYQENQERSAARNNGVKQANGQYICFLDSDDYFLEEKLNNLYKHIQRSNLTNGIYYDGIILEQNQNRTKIPYPFQKNLTPPDFIISSTFFSQQICGGKKIFEENNFNPKIRIGEDLDLWLRICEKHPFLPVKDSFQTVIVEHDNRSINLRKVNAAKEQLETLKYVFSNSYGLKVSYKLRRQIISNCLFNIAKYHMYHKHKGLAIFFSIRSILTNIVNEQTKHRFFCVLNIMMNKIPKQYLK